MQLILKDGTYYEDIKTNTYEGQQKVPFAKVHFKKYVINLDLSHLNNVDFNEKSDATTYRMMNVGQLGYAIDSLKSDFKQNITDYGNNMFRRTGFHTVSPSSPIAIDTLKKEVKKTASSPVVITSVRGLLKYLNHSQQSMILDMAINNNQSQFDNVEFRQGDVEYRYKLMNLHILNLSDKFALTVACFVLFFVAAPLGAFIKKGGIGLPFLVAMTVFLAYYFIGMFMKNIAENNTINPALAPWIPAIILLPFGIYLTARVTTDKAVFDFPITNRLLYWIKGKFKRKQKVKNVI